MGSEDPDDMSRWRYRVATFRFWGILFNRKNPIVGKESENTIGHGMRIGDLTDWQHNTPEADKISSDRRAIFEKRENRKK